MEYCCTEKLGTIICTTKAVCNIFCIVTRLSSCIYAVP